MTLSIWVSTYYYYYYASAVCYTQCGSWVSCQNESRISCKCLPKQNKL